MAKEKNLTTVTSVAAADFARLVTSAGASVKATAANLAKYIIETYNGSTVAGSAQSVKSALDSLNSKTKRTTTFVTGNPISVPIAGANDGAALLYGYLQGYNASTLLLITVVDGTVTITDMTTKTAVTAPVSATVSNGVLTVSTTNQSYSRVTLTSL